MRLFSWNIQWGRGMDEIVDLTRIVRTIRQLGNFDVICLQEVAINFPELPGSHGEDQISELSALLPGYIAIYGAGTDVPGVQGNRKQFGNAIFSRLPVGQVWRHLLPWQAELTTPSMQRILVEAVVTTAIGSVRIMTTHLEYYSQHQRNTQIDAIRRLHQEACAMSQRKSLAEEQGGTFEVFPRPKDALLCGDLNFPATAPEHTRILAPFDDSTPNFYDAWSILHPGKMHAPTVGIHPVDFVDRPECFDFLLITGELVKHLKAYGTDAATKASDHQPVWIELE